MRTTLLVTATAMALAACGSTAQTGPTVTGPGQAAVVDGLDGATGPGTVAGGPGTTDPGQVSPAGPGGPGGLAPGGTTPSTSGGPGGAGPVGTAPSRGAASVAAASGVGFTAREVTIGYFTDSSFGQAAEALGTTITTGDMPAQVRALVADLNRRGGILGRTVKVEILDTNSTSDPNSTAQQVCDHFTQDVKVAAVFVSVLTDNEILSSCLARRRTPLVISDAYPHRRGQFTDIRGFVFGPGDMTVERLAPVLVDRLVARGYFTGWDTTLGGPRPGQPVKIGSFYQNHAIGRAFNASLRQALARHGKKIEVTYEFSADGGTAVQQIPNAILKFRQEGVTHVISAGAAGLGSPFAEQQGYRPRWGMTSSDAYTLAETSSGKGQWTGAMGVGWLPGSDIRESERPKPSAAAQQCLDAVRRAGGNAEGSTQFVIFMSCENLTFLRDAWTAGGGLSPAALLSGAGLVNSRHQSAITFAFGMDPGSGLFDGALAVRDVGYDPDGCECFVYTSATNWPARAR